MRTVMVVVCDMGTSGVSVFKISNNEDACKVEPLECCAIASLVLADDQKWFRAIKRTAQAFVVDDDAGEVLIYAVTYGGADWALRSSVRSR